RARRPPGVRAARRQCADHHRAPGRRRRQPDRTRARQRSPRLAGPAGRRRSGRTLLHRPFSVSNHAMSLPAFDPTQYDAQLAEKLARFKADFAPLGLPEPEVFTSAPLAYRMRAEFRLWHHDGRVDYAMFDTSTRRPVLLEDFPPAASPIAQAMPRLREALNAGDELRRRIFQVEFLATLSGELLITLVYHRRLDAAWEAAARELATILGAQIIGR